MYVTHLATHTQLFIQGFLIFCVKKNALPDIRKAVLPVLQFLQWCQQLHNAHMQQSAWQVYYTQRLHALGCPTTTAVLRTAENETQCIAEQLQFYVTWYRRCSLSALVDCAAGKLPGTLNESMHFVGLCYDTKDQWKQNSSSISSSTAAWRVITPRSSNWISSFVLDSGKVATETYKML